MTETITWIDVRERLPRTSSPRLVFEGRSVDTGSYYGGAWHDDLGDFINPTHWAYFPTGPQPASQGRGGDTK